jgi:hypothetical protein
LIEGRHNAGLLLFRIVASKRLEVLMRKFIVWGSIAAGAVAAYLMYKRGTPIMTIAKKTILNPVGSLVGELKEA